MENRKRIIELLTAVRYTTNDIEKVADEICLLSSVVGQSKQLPNRCSVCGRTDEERLTMTSMCGVSACPY